MEGDAQSFSDDPRLTIFCLRIYILIYRDIIRMLESEIYYVVLHAYIHRERERERAYRHSASLWKETKILKAYGRGVSSQN